MRGRLAAAVLIACVLGGCDAAGEPSGTRTFSDSRVPFTFEIPADFTKASIDEGDTRGDVLAAAGLTKLDLIAVRRIAGGEARPGVFSHTTRGTRVTSELHDVSGQFWLECQYTPERAEKVLAACRQAISTVHRG